MIVQILLTHLCSIKYIFCRLQHSKSGTNSAGTSPVLPGTKRDSIPNSEHNKTSPAFPYHSNTSYVRTSRSEDHLQFQKDSSISAVDIEIDEDVTSSLNTLLDTRLDSGSTNNVSQTPTSDRIVWTYNAPVSSPSAVDNNCCHVMSNGSSSSQSRVSLLLPSKMIVSLLILSISVVCVSK